MYENCLNWTESSKHFTNIRYRYRSDACEGNEWENESVYKIIRESESLLQLLVGGSNSDNWLTKFYYYRTASTAQATVWK